MSNQQRWVSLGLAILSGFLLNAAFPDVAFWPSALVAIAALLAALRHDRPRWNALLGWLSGTIFFLLQLEFANFAVGPVPWLLLAALEGLALSLVAVTWTWLRRIRLLRTHPALHPIAFAILWVGAEQLRSAVPFGGFPWGKVAFSQAESPLGHLAWLGGTPLTSAVSVAAGVLLYRAGVQVWSWLARRHAAPDASTAGSSGRLRGGRAFLTALAPLFVALALVGAGMLIPLTTGAETGALRIGAVQGNVANPGLQAFDHQREVLDNHIAGTEKLIAQAGEEPLDVILWPENGTDIDPIATPSVGAEIDALAQRAQAPILIGTVQYPETGGRYNRGLLWEPGTGPIASYTKQHPVPFAEYIPMRSIARAVSSAVDTVTTDMLPGHELGLLNLPSERLGRTVILGDVICFEVAIDDLVRDTVAGGAELLVVQTNNASFGPTAESTQQLAMTRLRAIETGRTTVQVSTVGVSGIFLPDGSALQITELFTAAQMLQDVPLRTSLTPAVRWGPHISAAFSLLALGLALIAIGSNFARSRSFRRAAVAEGNHHDLTASDDLGRHSDL